MIKIKTFAEKEVLEEINFEGNLGEWLDSFNPQWRAITLLPFSVFIDGAHVSPLDFDKIVISEATDIEILTHPYGGVIKSVGKLFGGVLNFAFGWLMPRSRSQNHSRVNTPQGERMELSDLKANQARLGSTVPECFGRHMRFFDYLSEPRRYFKDKRQQEVESILCIGVGDYVVENISVGETNIVDLENTSAKVFKPNQDVEEYAHVWHTVKEVGATSNGTAGLNLSMELITGQDIEDQHPEGGYIFDGNTITRADGEDFNINILENDSVLVSLPLEYSHAPKSYTVGRGDYIATEVTGFFAHAIDSIGRSGWDVAATRLMADGTRSVRWYTYEEQQFWYEAKGLTLVPSRGKTTSIYGAQKKWKITKIEGDTITVSDGKGGYFPTMTSEAARLSYEVSPTVSRSELTNIYTSTPNGVKTSEIEMDFFFPQGLCYIRDDGGVGAESASVEVFVRDVDNPTFSYRQRFDYRDSTNDQIGFSERIKLPRPMRATVQMRRIGYLNNSVQSHSQVTWFGLKAKLPIVSRYKNWTTIGITMQSGGKIATQSENRLNAIVTRILPELQVDGSWSAPKPIRDIASFVRYIAHAIGYDDNDIDMNELLRLHNTYWKPRGEYFDYIFDETTVKQALDYAFNAGLSDFSISNGKITPVRDDIRTQVEHSYSAQNVVGDITHTFRSRQLDDFDGVEAEYVDDVTFDKKVVECKLPDSQGVKLRKTSLRGVTSRQRAWVAGMRLASEDRYVNQEFAFKTEMDALNSNYGSFIGVVTESPDMRMSCQILKVEKDHVILSESVPADYDVFAWRDEQGRYNGEYDIIRIDDNKVYVDLPKKPIVSLNMELPHAYIGKKDHFTYKCLVDEITPNGVDAASVKTSIYDERVYAYDDKVVQDDV